MNEVFCHKSDSKKSCDFELGTFLVLNMADQTAHLIGQNRENYGRKGKTVH